MRGVEVLPLHDAILGEININWENRIVEIHLQAFVKQGSKALPHLLKFEGVSNIEVPHNSPWGESFFVNDVSLVDDCCEVEMQSGDVVKIVAESFSFEPKTS